MDPVARMSTEQLRQFVLGYCDGLIFTSAQVSNARDIMSVFLPMAFSEVEVPEDVAVLWEWVNDALPRTVNGCPVFASVRMMHRDDWDRAHRAITREFNRRQTIEV